MKFDVPVIIGISKPGAVSGKAAAGGRRDVPTKLLNADLDGTAFLATRGFANFPTSITTSRAKSTKTIQGPSPP